MNGPLISVVIPNYNYAGFLPAAVASVADQTYESKELVLIDDCSTDDSLAVMRSLAKEHAAAFPAGVKVFRHEENIGAHAALNSGIDVAAGDILAILNADDLYEPGRLDLMQRAMEASGAPFAFSAVRCIGKNGEEIDTEFARKMRALPARAAGALFMLTAAAAENVAVSTGNMMFTKEHYAKTGRFRNYKYVHDYDFFVRAALLAEPVYVPQTDYLYRIHGDNSFIKLKDVGITENRLVWLDLYEAVKRGRAANPAMTRAGDYRSRFFEAVSEYGFQKKTLWHLAATPFGKALAALLRSTHGYERLSDLQL